MQINIEKSWKCKKILENIKKMQESTRKHNKIQQNWKKIQANIIIEENIETWDNTWIYFKFSRKGKKIQELIIKNREN